MKTTLRLELPPLPELRAESKVAFALLDRHVVQREGELPLAELAQAVTARRIEGILHPADSVVTAVTVPPLPAHRLSDAVAGAVEPLLLGDMESLALAHGARGADGSVAVAWAERAPLARALGLLAGIGLPLDALLPAPLALPVTENGWTVLARDTHVVVRTGPQSGQAWTIDPLAEDADPALAALRPLLETEAPAALGWIDPPPIGLAGIACQALTAQARWQGPAPDWSLALPELQAHRRNRSAWRRPAQWAAAAGAVWLLGLNAHAWQLGREEAALRQRMTAQVKAAFPDIPVVLDPLRQAEQRRDALRAAGGTLGEADFLPLALAASKLLPDIASDVVVLRYTRGELRLRPSEQKAGAPDQALAQRAAGTGLHLSHEEGEWIVRSGTAGPESERAGPVQAAVRIQRGSPQ